MIYIYNTLKSLNKLKDVYQKYGKSTQGHLFASENREKGFFLVATHPSRHKTFGACEKGTTAKFEDHHTNAIYLTTLF